MPAKRHFEQTYYSTAFLILQKKFYNHVHFLHHDHISPAGALPCYHYNPRGAVLSAEMVKSVGIISSAPGAFVKSPCMAGKSVLQLEYLTEWEGI